MGTNTRTNFVFAVKVEGGVLLEQMISSLSKIVLKALEYDSHLLTAFPIQFKRV